MDELRSVGVNLTKKINGDLFKRRDFLKNLLLEDCLIFGGCPRDLVSGTTVSDIDIATSYQSSYEHMEKVLFKSFYVKRTSRVDNNFYSTKPDWVEKVDTFWKEGHTTVQLVKTQKSLIEFLQNIDIRSCCLVVDRHGELHETSHKAYEHAKKRLLEVRPEVPLFCEGLLEWRIKKLSVKGYRLYVNTTRQKYLEAFKMELT